MNVFLQQQNMIKYLNIFVTYKIQTHGFRPKNGYFTQSVWILMYVYCLNAFFYAKLNSCLDPIPVAKF